MTKLMYYAKIIYKKGGIVMKKIYKWLKKKLKCFNEGHDYRYKELINEGYFICQRCGKVSRTAFWSKEE